MENLKPETRAGVLVEALPYLQEYNGKIVVVKYGGNAMINEDLKQAVIRDIVLLNLVGVKVVLVHGGGPEIGELLKKTEKSPNSSRVCAIQTKRRWKRSSWSSAESSIRIW